MSIAVPAVRLHAKAGTLAGEERWCTVKYLFLLYGTSETLPERAYLARRMRELA